MSRVLINGSSRGIGLELAKQYAANGDEVIACVRDASAAAQLDEAASGADNITIVEMDAGDPASIAAAAASIGEGAIDTVINNAFDEVVARILTGLEADIVQDKELRLGSEVGRIGNARELEIRPSLPCDVPRIPAVVLARDRIQDVADHRHFR